LSVCWELFHHEICIKIFANAFQQIRTSHRCHTEIHVALKYRKSCATLLTPLTVNWEQMAHGADNCCLLLKNHKLPCMNIIPCRGLQVNYFLSFQTLSTIKHAKLACITQRTGHREARSRELVNAIKILPVFGTVYAVIFCLLDIAFISSSMKSIKIFLC
jgi:hypothetical protein